MRTPGWTIHDWSCSMQSTARERGATRSHPHPLRGAQRTSTIAGTARFATAVPALERDRQLRTRRGQCDGSLGHSLPRRDRRGTPTARGACGSSRAATSSCRGCFDIATPTSSRTTDQPHRVCDPLRGALHADRYDRHRLPRRPGRLPSTQRSVRICARWRIATSHAISDDPRRGVELFRRAAAARRRFGGDASSVTRDYTLELDAHGAAAAVDLRRQDHHVPQARRRGGRSARAALGHRQPRPWTRTAPLPGGDMPGRFRGVPRAVSSPAIRGYPNHSRRATLTRVRHAHARVLGHAGSARDLGDEVLPDLYVARDRLPASRRVGHQRGRSSCCGAPNSALHVPEGGIERLAAWLAAHPRVTERAA